MSWDVNRSRSRILQFTQSVVKDSTACDATVFSSFEQPRKYN